MRLHAFDIVKVEHIGGSFTFGTISGISHITDAQSFLTGYISNDFGSLDTEAPTLRIGMNYAEASVSYNTKNIYTPVHNDAPVYLASSSEIMQALGLDRIQNPIVCGALTMYEGTDDEITLPVNMNSKFMLGPEGAHLNISGISGLAAKTSYAMFLMKAIQEKSGNDSAAFVIFNVKGKDLMAIDRPNLSLTEEERKKYFDLDLSDRPFKNVHYFIPYTSPLSGSSGSYLSADDTASYMAAGQLMRYKYCYEDDRESLEMLFADIEDPNQTMDAIISKIINASDPDFGNITTWNEFLMTVHELSQNTRTSGRNAGEISVLSWRKFKRIINKAIRNDDMFSQRPVRENHECRLADELKHIRSGDAFVIDIAKLSEDKQAFVFGDSLRAIYNLKLGEYDNEPEINPPSRIIIFIDELNKYASKDTPKTSPVLREILDVTERGRSLGVILFGAEQFRSAIHHRITGNCAVHAYGRTNSIETSGKDYSNFPSVYRSILSRLEQGEYLIQSPVFRSLLRIKFPRPVYRQFTD